MSKQKTKKQPEKKGEVVKLTNGMIDGFFHNQSIKKLRRLPGLRADVRFKLFRLWETILGSPQAKALGDTTNHMIAEHNKTQEKVLEKDRTALAIEDPKVQELFRVDSGLAVEKVIIASSQLHPDFTPADMSSTKWIIEFEE